MPIEERSPTGHVGNWFFGERAFVRDLVCAFSVLGARIHEYFNYGFNIPAGATINSVTVKVWHAEDGALQELWCYISWNGGVTWSGSYKIRVVGACAQSSKDELDAMLVHAWTPESLSDANLRMKVQSRTATGCMAYGSLVTMFDGSHKKIEDIKLGEAVLSWNSVEGQTKGIVVAINRHEYLKTYPMVKLVTDKANLVLSPQHMAACTKDHQFKDSENFKVGDTLLNEQEKLVKVTAIEKQEVHKLINIQIDKMRLYVEGFLVHNAEKEPW